MAGDGPVWGLKYSWEVPMYSERRMYRLVIFLALPLFAWGQAGTVKVNAPRWRRGSAGVARARKRFVHSGCKAPGTRKLMSRRAPTRG